MFKRLAAIFITGILLVNPIARVHASENITIEAYTQDVLKTNNIQLQQIPEGLNIDPAVYTAVRMGLLKGVRFDFSSPITEKEKKTIGTNLSKVVASGSDSNITVDTTEKSDNEAGEDTENRASVDAMDYQTPYGTIKTPNKNVLDGLWTDDEFHEILMESETNRTFDYILYRHFNVLIGEQPANFYYDPELRHFFVQEFIYDYYTGEFSHHEYIDVDEATNGLAFKALKSAIYYAVKYDLDVSFGNHQDGRAQILVTSQDNTAKFRFYISYNTDVRNVFYNIEGFDPKVNKVTTDWRIEKLWDLDLYAENGMKLSDATTAQRKNIHSKSAFSQQVYTDAIYALCETMYGSDSENIYKILIGEYLNERYQWGINEIDTEKKEMIESNSHNVYIYNPKQYDSFYGIEVK